MDSISLTDNKTQRYYLVDIFKFIAALLVVAVHCNPFSDMKAEIFNFWFDNCLKRIAVPFFFVSAGFFCFKKQSEENFDIKVTNRYAFRMLLLYSVWFLVYIIPKAVFSGFDLTGFCQGYILGYSHLWYLNASAFAFFVIGLLLYKKIKTDHVFIASAILYAVGLLGETYYGLLFNEQTQLYIYSSRNGLFFAPVFIMMGALFAYGRIKIKLSFSIIGFVVSFVLMFFETLLVDHFDLARSFGSSIFLVPTLLFLFALLLNIKIRKCFDTKILSKISAFIYFIHMFVYLYIIPLVIKAVQIIRGGRSCSAWR